MSVLPQKQPTGAEDHATSETSNPASQGQTLELGAHIVAQVSHDPRLVNALVSTSAEAMPAIELLEGLSLQNPSGVVVVEHGEEGLAFALDMGRIVGALGTGALGLIENWCESAQAQGLQTDPNQSTWMAMAAEFVQRCVLDRLEIATRVGSQVTVYRGEVEWVESRIETEAALPLSHYFMELAREVDERSILLKRLAPLNRRAYPTREPTPPAKAQVEMKRAKKITETSFAGILEEAPEELNHELEQEHANTLLVWSLCNKKRSITEICQLCVLGSTKTLHALLKLYQDHNIILTTPLDPKLNHSASSESTSSSGSKSSSGTLPPSSGITPTKPLTSPLSQELIENFIGDMPQWLAQLDESAWQNQRRSYAQICANIVKSAQTLGLQELSELATQAHTLAQSGRGELSDPVYALEAAYATAFRALMTKLASRP